MSRLPVFRLSLVCAFAAACGSSGAENDTSPLRCAPGETLFRGECRPAEEPEDSVEADVDVDVPEDLSQPDLPVDSDPVDEVADTAACVDAALRCEGGIPQSCTGGVWVNGASCAAAETCVGGRCVPGANCIPGTVLGCANETAQLMCNTAGNAWEPAPCTDAPFCLNGICGTQRCEPGVRACDDDGRWVTECDITGENFVPLEDCNPRDNLACVLGECISGCAAALKDPSYVGCEYWSVDLPQFQDPFGDPRAIPHAVVVSNTGDRPADITIETESGIGLITRSATVAPGDVGTLIFPRADVENTSRSRRSFRITTTQPVVAYQFNPLNDEGVASNDASLLLPANAIGREYYVMAWPSGPDALGFGAQTGWFTVVAPREGETVVTITFAANLIDGTDADLRGIREGQTKVFRLQQWDVMNFEAQSQIFSIGDVTGSHITSDKPIVVFAGHEEAVIGERDPESDDGPCCADHMEEQLLPVNVWRNHYLAVHSPPRGSEKDFWRVMAARNGTTITTVPSIAGLDGRTLNEGEFIEISTRESFEIFSSAPVQVGQYIVSQTADGINDTKGDPAFILSVPVEQFLSKYAFLTPADYDEDWVTIVKPAGAVVQLDGVTLSESEFTPFGTSNYVLAWRAVNPGPHSISSPGDEGFGIYLFGYNNAVSYGYPGGLNLITDEE